MINEEELIRQKKVKVAKFILEGILDMHMLLLKSKPHIKKYRKYMILQYEVLDSMLNYINNGHYQLYDELSNIRSSVLKETKNNLDVAKVNFDLESEYDFDYYMDLSVYKNHDEMRSILDDYINKNKFKNALKVEMLDALRKSFVSFFKITNIMYDQGMAELEDLLTNKRYTVIDPALSESDFQAYIYARLISIDGINYLSTLGVFTKKIKKVNNYIKDCKYKKKSSLVRTLEVYQLYMECGSEYCKYRIIDTRK